jgi:hypothetical protein
MSRHQDLAWLQGSAFEADLMCAGGSYWSIHHSAGISQQWHSAGGDAGHWSMFAQFSVAGSQFSVRAKPGSFRIPGAAFESAPTRTEFPRQLVCGDCRSLGIEWQKTRKNSHTKHPTKRNVERSILRVRRRARKVGRITRKPVTPRTAARLRAQTHVEREIRGSPLILATNRLTTLRRMARAISLRARIEKG